MEGSYFPSLKVNRCTVAETLRHSSLTADIGSWWSVIYPVWLGPCAAPEIQFGSLRRTESLIAKGISAYLFYQFVNLSYLRGDNRTWCAY